jgi:hypothetical protein
MIRIMLVTLLLPALMGVRKGLMTPTVWFGPATASFHSVFDGDPFDPAQNDVKVKFTGEHGEVYERIAYFDGNGYSATLVAPTKGKFKAVLMRNGKTAEPSPDDAGIVLSSALPNGFIRLDPAHANRFKWDSGQPYFPVGIDLAWKAGPITLVDQIAKVGASGANWARIWACTWDSKNPWWPNNDPSAQKNQMWLPALQQWAQIVSACDKASLPFQFTLFHHGEVCTTTDANWPGNPWNAANGGFLKDPADFFTDPEAKRRVKMWLRYAVARYGSSPSVLSWELFNEVQWVDAMKTRSADVATWHKEMADYLRSIDPYHHLVTSSSTLDYPDIIAPLDYLQPHTYPADISASILGTPLPAGKPVFYGEFGPSGSVNGREAMRDGLYAGILANQAGAGEYWYWDVVEKDNLYSELTTGQHVATLSEVAKHPDAHPSRLTISAPGGADLVLRPGGGWTASTKLTFNLPQESTPKDLGGLSTYIQGTSHRDMFPKPLELKFSLDKLGTVVIKVGSVSKAGATIEVSDNDTVIQSKIYAASDGNERVHDTISIPLHPGSHDIKINNLGGDWFTLSSLTIPGLGQPVRVIGLEDVDWFLARLTTAPGVANPVPLKILGASPRDGTYQMTVVDLDTGKDETSTMEVKNDVIGPIPVTVRDCVLLLRKK